MLSYAMLSGNAEEVSVWIGPDVFESPNHRESCIDSASAILVEKTGASAIPPASPSVHPMRESRMSVLTINSRGASDF